MDCLLVDGGFIELNVDRVASREKMRVGDDFEERLQSVPFSDLLLSHSFGNLAGIVVDPGNDCMWVRSVRHASTPFKRATMLSKSFSSNNKQEPVQLVNGASVDSSLTTQSSTKPGDVGWCF